VAVYNLNVMRIAVTPGEAAAPQQFQPISRRYAQILQPPCLIQVQKLPPRRPLDGLKSPDRAVFKERSGVRALERTDQGPFYDAPSIMSNVIDGEGGPNMPAKAG
jgi:hypothetical protein